MKIILTKTFIKDFEKEFKNHNISHIDLVNKLKSTRIISLTNPYVKIKITIKWISIRWIWIFNDFKKLIPIFFVLKKNNQYWKNLVMNKEILQKINNKLATYKKDFNNWNIFEF